MTCRPKLAGFLIVASIAAATSCVRGSAPQGVGAAAPAGDSVLRERDAALLREIDALTSRCATVWSGNRECVEAACRLRTRELDLFAEVRAHTFTDITESNYWHRGRLKFPGDLEQLFQRLPREPQASAPACAGRR